MLRCVAACPNCRAAGGFTKPGCIFDTVTRSKSTDVAKSVGQCKWESFATELQTSRKTSYALPLSLPNSPLKRLPRATTLRGFAKKGCVPFRPPPFRPLSNSVLPVRLPRTYDCWLEHRSPRWASKPPEHRRLEDQRAKTPLGKAVVRTIAIPGDVFVASTAQQDQKAKTPLGKAVVRGVAIPGDVLVASLALTQSAITPPNPNNKKNRFTKRGK